MKLTLLPLCVAIILLSCKTQYAGRQSTQSYTCGNTHNGHCYSEATLGDHFTGFTTTMSVVKNFHGGDGFITNEFWLSNYNGVNGWIEVGVSSTEISGGNGNEYFYAFLDPETALFHHFTISPVPDDEIGSRVVLDVHQIADNTFSVSVKGSKTNFTNTIQVHLWDGFYGGSIKIGQELAGSNGAQASLTEFVENKFYKGSTLRYVDELNLPSESIGQPPYGGWLEKPTSTNKGGIYSTYCCVR